MLDSEMNCNVREILNPTGKPFENHRYCDPQVRNSRYVHPNFLLSSSFSTLGRFATVQDLCGSPISVSHYANHNYIPNASSLPPETVQSCRLILSGDNVSNVDPGKIVSSGFIAANFSGKLFQAEIERPILLLGQHLFPGHLTFLVPRHAPEDAA